MSSRLDLCLGAALILAVLLACANASPVFRLDATGADSSSTWVQGRQILTRTADSLTVSIAYERSTSRDHVFRMVIRNRGDSTVLVDPTDVVARVATRRLSGVPTDSLPSQVVRERVRARDPEEEILKADLRQSREQAEATNAAAFNLLAVTLDAAGDVAAEASGNRTEQERTTDAVEDAAFAERTERQAARRRRTISALDRTRRLWSSVALRKTTLPPGTHAGGRLYVPIVEDGRFVELRIEAAPHVFSFVFQQQRYDP
jgi:hypothetical protein